MKFTLILGSPRSGTSIVASLIEKMGLDFGITSENTLDGIYKAGHSFNQRKDIHLFLAGLNNVENMTKCNTIIDKEIFINNKSQVIKEPYLLFVLDQIRDFILNIVFVIRNPTDVISSQKTFIKNNGGGPSLNFQQKWNNYHKLFITSIGDIPYTVINYNALLKSPTTTIKNLQNFLKKFLSIDREISLENSEDLSAYVSNKFTEDRRVLSASTMYLYRFITLNSGDTFINTIDDSSNAKCFCNSGKKYKKCCVSFTS